MTQFIQFVNHLTPLDLLAADCLSNRLEPRTLDKGEYLLKSGQVCRHLYFIDKGLVKTFFTKEEKQFIMRFFPENSMFTVLDSFLTGKPSTYSVLALEPTAVTCISKTEMDTLCADHHCVETFLRNLVSLASVNMMNRISEMLEENATERYNHFVRESHPLLQRISLGDLAGYLGITQVSLSRIRAGKRF